MTTVKNYEPGDTESTDAAYMESLGWTILQTGKDDLPADCLIGVKVTAGQLRIWEVDHDRDASTEMTLSHGETAHLKQLLGGTHRIKPLDWKATISGWRAATIFGDVEIYAPTLDYVSLLTPNRRGNVSGLPNVDAAREKAESWYHNRLMPALETD